MSVVARSPAQEIFSSILALMGFVGGTALLVFALFWALVFTSDHGGVLVPFSVVVVLLMWVFSWPALWAVTRLQRNVLEARPAPAEPRRVAAPPKRKALPAPPVADPRLDAAKVLADRCVALAGADVRTIDAARRLEDRLGAVVTELHALQATGVPQVHGVRAELEGRSAQMLQGLSDLYLALVSREAGNDADPLAALNGVIGRLDAEAEVDEW